MQVRAAIVVEPGDTVVVSESGASHPRTELMVQLGRDNFMWLSIEQAMDISQKLDHAVQVWQHEQDQNIKEDVTNA